jgi:hypothetical protein
VRIA